MTYKERTPDDPKWWPSRDEWVENESCKHHGQTYTDLYCKRCHGAGWLHPVNSDGTPNYRNVITCNCKRKNADAKYDS